MDYHNTFVSDHPIIGGLWSGRSVGPLGIRDVIKLELEKEMIREEILAEEIERRRVLGAEMGRESMIEYEIPVASRIGGFPTALVQRQPLRAEYEPEMMRYDQQFQSENRRFQMPFRRQLSSEVIVLGESSGSKQKALAPATKEDFSCAVCQISVTCARDLQKHISGKKHQAKVGAIKADRKKITMRHKKGKKIMSGCKKGKRLRKRHQEGPVSR